MDITRTDEEVSRLVGRCVTWWRTRMQARANAWELDGLAGDDMARLAHDLAISPDELRDLASDEKGSALMERMMAAHGLSAAEIRREAPALMRDMAVACARCGDKGRCQHDLDAGTAHEHAAHYCPNVPNFLALGR